MPYKIKKTAVLGAGVMGASIAGHFANAGYPCILLDIVPPRLTPEDEKAGLTKESPKFRNRLAEQGKQGMKKAKPSPIFTKSKLDMIETGNFEDDLSRLKDADLVVEAIIENMEIKKKLFTNLAPNLSPTCILTSNTSGLSINDLAKTLPEELRGRFCGTHFFNPPRYMKLLEVIPGEDTDSEVLSTLVKFGEYELGKGIVHAKDTPNFIANRIGVYALMLVIHKMAEMGMTVEEVDALTGRPIGHPKTASFRTADLVGLDTLLHVANNVYEGLVDDPYREVFKAPQFLKEMVEKGLLGGKAGKGFYKKIKSPEGKSIILSLDYNTMEYTEQGKASFGSVSQTKGMSDAGERIKAMMFAEDKGGEFTWKTTAPMLNYAAYCVPEISDDIVNVDNAMKWGFNWKLGPFETFDAVGVEQWAEKWTAEGNELPSLVKSLLDSGKKTFYEREKGVEYFFDIGKKAYEKIDYPPQYIDLSALKEQGRTIKENAGASLIDIGDGVACLEFHTKMNAIGPDIINMMKESVEEVENNWEGMVISNQSSNFSVGANLQLILMTIMNEEWDELEWVVKSFQEANMRLRYSSKPVIAAPFGLTLGGGCEVTLGADAVRAAAETYIGMVELGVGVIPAGGGTKEMVRRHAAMVPDNLADADIFPFIRRGFEAIGMAKVATSGEEAREFGFFTDRDGITMNKDFLIHDAKQMVLSMVREGYREPRPAEDIPVLGSKGIAAIKVFLFGFQDGNWASAYDVHLGNMLAKVICGGDVAAGTRVSEQYLLELEREVFLSLCGQRKTQERMKHMLEKGKPLRN